MQDANAEDAEDTPRLEEQVEMKDPEEGHQAHLMMMKEGAAEDGL